MMLIKTIQRGLPIILLKYSLIGITFIWLLIHTNAYANTPHTNDISVDNTELLSAALTHIEQAQLWLDPYWFKLLYYQKKSNDDIHSLVNPSSHFFLSDTGVSDPKQELLALTRALLTPSPNTTSDDLAYCLFPVRSNWLLDQLHLAIPRPPCTRYQTWINGISPRYTTLVFSDGYIDNPSSMFGHTLLRIDASDQKQLNLISYAINYTAQTDTETGLKYAYKGLVGLFPGAFQILPYYIKVNEYSAAENRDLWEYRLTLSPDETLRLVQHLWELRNVSFPYYYINRNCSYQLLSLLEVARPTLDLTSHFTWSAVPTDTLRVTLHNAQLLQKTTFRPAQAKKLRYRSKQLPHNVIETAKQLAKDPQMDITQLTMIDQANALSLAADYLNFYHIIGRQNTTLRHEQIRILLTRRSQIEYVEPALIIPPPTIDPTNGHATRRIMLGSSFENDHWKADIELRPSYHDTLDPSGGYQSGATINFFRTRLQYDTQQHLKLRELEIIGIESIAPHTDFIKPKSWAISTGIHRTTISDLSDPTTTGYASGSLGISHYIGSASCYGLLDAIGELGPRLTKGWSGALGPRIGCMGSTGKLSYDASITSLFITPTDRWRHNYNTSFQYMMNNSDALRLRVTHQQDASSNAKTSQTDLLWVHYF